MTNIVQNVQQNTTRSPTEEKRQIIICLTCLFIYDTDNKHVKRKYIHKVYCLVYTEEF